MNEGSELDRKKKKAVQIEVRKMKTRLQTREKVEKYIVGCLKWELKRKGIQGIKANSRSLSIGNQLD